MTFCAFSVYPQAALAFANSFPDKNTTHSSAKMIKNNKFLKITIVVLVTYQSFLELVEDERDKCWQNVQFEL